MTKATTPFKMFYVELPEAKPFTAKTVRCYLDLETGNIFGSKEVISRFLHKKEIFRQSVCKSVLPKAQELMDYYWNKDDKGKAIPVWIRGQVVKQKTLDSFDKNTGRGMKIDFVLL